MFVFEDIIYLDDISIQRFLRDVDTKDLAVALKSANEEVSRVIFQNMSKRSQETIAGDMEYLHNVRMRDVEEAQQRIVDAIRRLEEELEEEELAASQPLQIVASAEEILDFFA